MAHPASLAQSGNSSPSSAPLLNDARRKCQEVFQRRLCLWQYLVTSAVFARKHVIINVGTGMGKTLAFLLPLLFWEDGIVIIITALNILGKQIAEQLMDVGIPAISISGENATPMNFRVSKSS